MRQLWWNRQISGKTLPKLIQKDHPKIPTIIKLILYLKAFLQRKLGSNVFIDEFYQTFKGGIPNRRQWKRGDISQLILQNNYPGTKNKDCKKTKLQINILQEHRIKNP